MSMDQSAIREITANAVAISGSAAQALAVISKDHRPVLALPDNFKIQDLEGYLPHRTRTRGAYNTSAIACFADYCKAYQEFPVFVDEESMKAVALLNYTVDGQPGHCDHTATLSLRKTAPFKALLSMNGSPAGQRKLAEWMEDWRDFITCQEVQGGPALNIAAVIASIRKVTVEATSKKDSAIGSFSSEKSDLERLEAKGEALPGFIEFTCAPYQDLPARSFTMRVALHAEGDVRFSLHIIQLEMHEQEMAIEMGEKIKSSMDGNKANIVIGTFKP